MLALAEFFIVSFSVERHFSHLLQNISQITQKEGYIFDCGKETLLRKN